MLKPLHLLIAGLYTFASYGQKTDTLILLYKSDKFVLSKQDKQKLDTFLSLGWDRIAINGYTDEADTDEYNMELSKKRSDGVFDYLVKKGISTSAIASKNFGETMPQADNISDEGRALNRRTEIIGYQFGRIMLKPKEDLMKPVTRVLNNGFMITYRPGAMPAELAANFEAGSGIDFQLISNTTEMRQNNFFNNTTQGDILSSMLIISFDRLVQCNLDSPVLLRVPVPYRTDCNLLKLKFFVSVYENGKRIWREENKQVFTERIGGVSYACVWVENFCGSVNFDFKIPECYDTDSTQLLFVNTDLRHFSTELKGVNSVYLPRKTSDSTYSILYLKNKLKDAALTFSLYKGKKRFRGYRDRLLTDLPYREETNQYVVSLATVRFNFPKVRVIDVVLKINNDKYRVEPQDNQYEFSYLNRSNEKILVDFIVAESKRSEVHYRNQPLSSIPYDKENGCYVINKSFLKSLKQPKMVAMR